MAVPVQKGGNITHLTMEPGEIDINSPVRTSSMGSKSSSSMLEPPWKLLIEEELRVVSYDDEEQVLLYEAPLSGACREWRRPPLVGCLSSAFFCG